MKATFLFILLIACLVIPVSKAQADGGWFNITINPVPRVVASPQPIPQYEKRVVPVYDICGNLVAYREESVLIGYTYPQGYYYQNRFWFTIRSSGPSHHRDCDYRREDHRRKDSHRH